MIASLGSVHSSRRFSQTLRPVRKPLRSRSVRLVRRLRRRGVDLAFGFEPILEVVAGLEAAGLRAAVRGAGDAVVAISRLVGRLRSREGRGIHGGLAGCGHDQCLLYSGAPSLTLGECASWRLSMLSSSAPGRQARL